MQIYYIDEQLSQAEQLDVAEQLADFGENIEAIEYKRIPFVFPVDGEKMTNEEMMTIFCGHLKNAGITKGQHVFLMPKDFARWGILFQSAFETVAGYLPYVVQPWHQTGDSIIRRDYLMVMDMNAVMSGL